MRFLLICFFSLYVLNISAQKEVCFTLDDLPLVSYGKKDPAHLQEITQKLLGHFDQYQIPAIGYVNEQKLYTEGQLDDSKVALLEQWLKRGYELGNHTYAHLNYHRTSYEAYTQNILKGEQITRLLTEKYQSELRFFRHPYLRVGQTAERHDSLTQFLNTHGYTEAPVSIDNADYLFAKAYFIAYKRSDKELMKRIGKDYIDYMERKLHYFERSADTLFQRPIKHILLLHANLINADYLGELARMFQKNGYKFISQEEALKDPAYATPITAKGYGDWGISWLDRWALSQGKKGAFFKDDPRVPDYIAKPKK